MGTLLTGAPNARGYEKITFFDQYRADSGSLSELMPDKAIVTMEGE